MAEPGDLVGGYTLRTRLGSGGTGTVWEAVDGTGRAVALKRLHPGISADPAARERLQREVSSLERLRGAHVAQVLDVHIEPHDCYLVTTLVDGATLEASVEDEGAFHRLDLAPLAQGLFQAVNEVHRVGLLHRDIKPGNVMVTYEGPVLIDFGIAQLVDDARLTSTGFVTGTPGYLDPTTLYGAKPGRDGDWYGLAAVLLFAATGRPPFGTGRMDVVLGRMSTNAPDVEGLPQPVADAFRAALASDPANRPAPGYLIDVLQAYADTRPIPALPPALRSAPQPTTTAPPPAATPGLPATAHLPAPPAPSGAPLPPSFPPRAPHQQPGPYPPAASAPLAPQPLPPSPAPTGVPQGPMVPDPAQAPMPEWARPPRHRPGLVLAWGAVACIAAIGWPGPIIIVVAVVFVLLTLLGMLRRRTQLRRSAAGPRRTDTWVSVGWSLPLLIPAAITSLLPLFLGGLAAAATWWIGTRLADGEVVGAVPALVGEFMAPVALAVGLVVAWWVPVAEVTRLGARVLWSACAPTVTATRIWLGVALVIMLVLAVAATTPVWSPFPDPSGVTSSG